jgi:membrane fusion protein (multidrug efflux system)
MKLAKHFQQYIKKQPGMIRNILILLIFASLIAGCAKSELEEKKAKLEELKASQKKTEEEIATLEKEVAKLDTSVKKESKVTNIAITPVNTQPFRHFIEVQGRVDADQNITISAKTGGAITRINVSAGDKVSAGQVLAEIDNALVLQGIAELKTGLAFATSAYNKQKKLWDQKIGSEMQYLTAKNQKESLEGKLATMYSTLDMSRIKSPISGTVDEVMLKLGQTIAPGMPAVRVVNLSKLKAKAEVPEAYASKVKIGNSAMVFFPDIKKEVNTKITFTGKVINPTNRTFTVEVALDPSKNEYHPNMIAVVKIADYENMSAVVVPVNMVQYSETGPYVMVAVEKNGQKFAKRNTVKIGGSYNGLAEITEGLLVGEKLITTGYIGLNEGDRIKY